MDALNTIIKEHITYKKQVVKLAKSDLIKTYRGSALGWAWAVIKPVVTIFVFWFAFSIGLRSGGDVDGYPFFLWMIAGFVPWFYMSEMITSGAGCMRANKHLITKMKFPISVIPTFTNISKLTIHLVLLGATIIIYILFGYLPDIYYLQLPVYILLMFVFFNFWALFAGLLSAISKDFLNLVKSFTTAIFWISGIMYNVSKIEYVWMQKILMFNPVTLIANGYRHTFIDKTWFFESPVELRNYLIVLFVMVVLSCWAYKKVYKDLADVL